MQAAPMLITAFPASVKRTTRETALARNRLVLALAVEHCVPYVAADSPLAQLVSKFSDPHQTRTKTAN